MLEGSLGKADGPASVFIDTIWFGVGSNGFTYYGTSQTTGGETPAIGDPHGTSTFSGWSNPSPTHPYVPPPRDYGTAVGAPPPPELDPRYSAALQPADLRQAPAAAVLLRPAMNRIRFLAVLAAAALPIVASLPAVAQTADQSWRPQGHRPAAAAARRAVDDRAQRQGRQAAGGKLVLEGVSPNAIIFADRPVRSAGHALTAHLLEEWSGNDSFAKTPPNATVSVLMKAKAAVVDAVVVLKSPKLEGDKLTFDVDVLEGDLAGGDGAASVFMDIINLPIARRTSHRGAWYHGTN